MTMLWSLLLLAMAAIGLLTLAGFGSRLWWPLDLTSHFRLQYLIILVAFALVFLAAGWTTAGLASAGFGLVNLVTILPLYRPQAVDLDSKRSYRLLMANVWQPNRSYDQVCQLVQQVQPDWVALVETNQEWLDNLERLHEQYPHWNVAVREDNYGLALLSRFPLTECEQVSFCDLGVPTLISRLSLEGRPLTLITTHPPPPKGPLNTAYRDQQMRRMAEYTAAQAGLTMACGDFNLTPWNPVFQRFVQQSGLSDSSIGFGLQPSWPVNNFLVRVPIDHCLASSSIQFTCRELGPAIGSDHFPLILEFSIR